jgi:hypothetical protein
MKIFWPLFALCAVGLGCIVPLHNLISLWQLPMESGIRPMEAPIAFVLFGCGTPALVIGLGFYIFKKSKEPGSVNREAMIARTLICIAGVLSLLPTFLTTYGSFWVIKTRHLWLEP